MGETKRARAMKLARFRVTNFRSVEDSDWIDADDVVALIGTNESGKTNVLLPLWKLNPAKEGQIDPTSDYPRKLFTTLRQQKPQPVFIEAVFELEEPLAADVAKLSGMPVDQLRTVSVKRQFDGVYIVDFPDAAPKRTVQSSQVIGVVNQAETEFKTLTAEASEEALKAKLLGAAAATRAALSKSTSVTAQQLEEIARAFQTPKAENPEPGSFAPRQQRLISDIRALKADISHPHPKDVKEVTDLILKKMPKFVYYSNYGNLDSEIYLPHVIENLKRTDLGLKDQAKARTLRVLFEFVRLSPTEILELGREPATTLTTQQVEEIADKKRQRSILLQSASADLTSKFRDWWKQGDYRFRFEADGNHFRIWVSDDKRPEEIELEGRSTGLQWFLSFYLVFLVERSEAHADAILLLDEPGLSLHPLAQNDLSAFFDGLAKTNQLLYTSHSPFLIDADRLDRARKVFVTENGTSKVTSDLSRGDGSVEKRGAGYAVYSALGLTVAESFLLGCTPVVVEGPSDQHYLSAIKLILVAAGKLKPERELIFPPSGGAKGVKAVSSILGGRDEQLPVVLCDSDAQGIATAKSLREGIYAGEPDRILEVSHFTSLANSEIEDLLPPEVIAEQLDRWLRTEKPFSNELQRGEPIIPQIEAWAQRYGIKLDKPGWKVELAKRVKAKMLSAGHQAFDGTVIQNWAKLFDAFQLKPKAQAAQT